ncbi:MAG TPA: contact-dependent growth inhibition system immunity protein [Candidatus Dormibacteraeota bacterium]|nr:contact-dependent growth inhibition system immunity protein [Candidatus Dormibacteraeota bacterium]
MKRNSEKKEFAFSAADYPRLTEFFDGYLHQEFRDEYGSPGAAAQAYCNDASHQQVVEAESEWAKLRKNLEGQAISKWQEVVDKLGGSWRPQTEEDLLSLEKVFRASV